jgi:hypothetical protein
VDKRQSKRTVAIEVSLILLFCQELSASEGVVFGRNPWAADHPAHEKTAKQALFRRCFFAVFVRRTAGPLNMAFPQQAKC